MYLHHKIRWFSWYVTAKAEINKLKKMLQERRLTNFTLNISLMEEVLQLLTILLHIRVDSVIEKLREKYFTKIKRW